MHMNYTKVLRENSSELYQRDPREDVVLFFLGVQASIVVLINASIILFITLKRSLQTVTNLCLGSLAMSDMLTGLIVIPLVISCNSGNSYKFGTCLAMDLGNRFLAISTILHLLVITCERYYTIVFSQFACGHSYVTVSEAFTALPGLWIFALMSSLVQLFWVFDPDDAKKHRFTVAYDLIVLSVLVLLPLVIMAIAYTHIFCVLRRQVTKITRGLRHLNKQAVERHNRKERKALLIYGTMLLVFLTAWFNYFFLTLQEDLGNQMPKIPHWASIILLFVRFSTGILNPILYTFLKHDFRNARKSLNVCNIDDKRPKTESASTANTVVIYKKSLEPDIDFSGHDLKLIDGCEQINDETMVV